MLRGRPGAAGSDLRQAGPEGSQFIVRGNIVVHDAVVELFISDKIKVSGTGEAEEDRLLLAGFLAFQRFIDSGADCVAAFRRRQNALGAGKEFRRLEDPGLGNGVSKTAAQESALFFDCISDTGDGRSPFANTGPIVYNDPETDRDGGREARNGDSQR